VAGNLDPAYFLGGSMRLDAGAAGRVVGELASALGLPAERVASGIIEIAEAKMLAALRAATVERGYDPRSFTLVVFGGAAGLHAAELARKLRIEWVVIPPNPAVFSAWGLLHAAPRYDLVRTVLVDLASGQADGLEPVLSEMEAEATSRVDRAGLSATKPAVRRWADLRYGGQDFTLQVALPPRLGGDGDMEAVSEQFASEHLRRFGYVLDAAVVLVNLRVSAVGTPAEPRPARASQGGEAMKGRRHIFDRASGRMSLWPVYERSLLRPHQVIEGAAVVEEPQSTHLVMASDSFHVDALGNLFVSVRAGGG